MKKAICTYGAPVPGYYTQGILIDPQTHSLLFLAGQTGNMPGVKDEPVVDGGVYAQTYQALENLLAVVMKAGGTAHSFTALNVFLEDSGYDAGRIQAKEDFEKAYRAF